MREQVEERKRGYMDEWVDRWKGNGRKKEDGWMHPFPWNLLNGKEHQRMQAVKKGGQQRLTWWPEPWTWSCRAEFQAQLCPMRQLCGPGHVAQPQQASAVTSVKRG